METTHVLEQKQHQEPIEVYITMIMLLMLIHIDDLMEPTEVLVLEQRLVGIM